MKKIIFLLSLIAIAFTGFSQTSAEWQTYNGWSVQDVFITGQSAQSTLNNNVFLATAGAGSIDCIPTTTVSYRSFAVQIIGSAGISAGAITFEASNDNTTFSIIPVYETSVFTGASITTAAITISASTSRFFAGNTTYRYVRCRISTAFTGGTIQAITKFKATTYTPTILNTVQATATNMNVTAVQPTAANLNVTAAQATAANLNATAILAAGTANTGYVGLQIPLTVADQASAAITTTTTSATITPAFGSSYEVNIIVTAVSGTTPTMDVEIQESDDAGTNWFAVYDFERITATGQYRSPVLRLKGNRVRYVATLAGTTPSFTRSINRLQSSSPITNSVVRLIDRTIAPNTLSSTSVSINSEDAKNFVLAVNSGTATTAAVYSLQGSEDGTNYFTFPGTLSATASTTVSLVYLGYHAKFVRAVVSTAGSAAVLNYLSISAY